MGSLSSSHSRQLLRGLGVQLLHGTSVDTSHNPKREKNEISNADD